MSDEAKLFASDAETELRELVEQAHKNPVVLREDEVEVIGAGRAIAGESWGQKLAPYQSWTAGPAAEFAGGTDGDLYPVGVLGMGLDEERLADLLAQARERDEGVELSGGAHSLGRAGGCDVGAGARVEQSSGAPTSGAAACVVGSGDVGAAQALAGPDVAGLLGVRRGEDGWIVASVDVRGMAERLGTRPGEQRDLVVVLPSFIGGVPVVRIAPEAFARRHVQGVGVRLLVVPDTVRTVGSNAFAALAVRHIHLGAGVENAGEQRCDMGGTSPVLDARTYSVAVGNPRLFALEGSLYERVNRENDVPGHTGAADGRRFGGAGAGAVDVDAKGERPERRPDTSDGFAAADLVFAACPYGTEARIEPFVRNVRPSAFVQGCAAPSVVRCGAALRRVNAKDWDDAVWICPPEAPVASLLRRRGVRMASEQAVCVGGCWYDFELLADGAAGEGAGVASGVREDEGVPSAAPGTSEGSGFGGAAGAVSEDADVSGTLDAVREGAVLVAGPPKPASVSASFARQAASRAAGLREGDEARAALSPAQAARQAAHDFAASGQAGVPVDATATFVGDVLSLPAEVAGRPLVRIGPRALPWAPATVVIGPSVRAIDGENTCKSTLHLVLSEGLEKIGPHCFCSRKLREPVELPRSVRSVGPGSFEYALVRLGDGALVAHVSSSQVESCFRGMDSANECTENVAEVSMRPAENASITDAYVTGPMKTRVLPAETGGAAEAVERTTRGVAAVRALFDVAAYDQQLVRQARIPDFVGALVHRLASEVPMEDDVRRALLRLARGADLREEVLQRVAREGDRRMVERLVDVGLIDDETFDAQIELLRRANRADCVAFLMERRRRDQGKAGGGTVRSRERFAL